MVSFSGSFYDCILFLIRLLNLLMERKSCGVTHSAWIHWLELDVLYSYTSVIICFCFYNISCETGAFLNPNSFLWFKNPELEMINQSSAVHYVMQVPRTAWKQCHVPRLSVWEMKPLQPLATFRYLALQISIHILNPTKTPFQSFQIKKTSPWYHNWIG
jgi:hypothetical protein